MVDMDFPLRGQRALVTGASGGIGAAVAVRLAAAGVGVSVTGRDASRLAATCRACEAHGPATSFVTDLAAEGASDDLARKALEKGPLDVLVHSAGLVSVGTLGDATPAEFERLLRLNAIVPHALTRQLLPALRERRGQVVFVNSSVGQSARAGLGLYSASKHALRAIADALRQEENAGGIRVLSVYVGRCATAMQATLAAAEGRVYEPAQLLQPEDVAAAVVQNLALPRTAEVTDVHVRPMLKS